MAADSTAPIVIIGAGMAGLTCANYLHRAGRRVVVLEAADAVGGRVRTDLTADGFRLDRGFQVLLTKYPEVQRLLDYGALKLRAFRSGTVPMGEVRAPNADHGFCSGFCKVVSCPLASLMTAPERNARSLSAP